MFKKLDENGFWYMDAKMPNFLIDDDLNIKICDTGSLVNKTEYLKGR